MINKVRQTIDRYAMLKDGDRVVVGLSGGADSMSLLSVMQKLRDEKNLNLAAVHINHCIRGEEADRDEAFVRDYCKRNGIELTVFSKNIPEIAKETGESEEECGRRIRYECFSQVCADGVIATAHTLSDSLETMIFNMLRGCTATGLCGIPPKRDNIIRPLISCTRQEIENYCRENDVSYVTDSTNLESDYSRNYIRNEIMPMFSEINPSYVSALERCQNSVKSDNAYLEKTVNDLYEESVCDNSLEISALKALNEAIRSRLIYKFISDKAGVSAENKHISLVMDLLEKEGAVQLSADCFIVAENQRLTVAFCEDNAHNEKWLVKAELGVNTTPGGKIEISAEDKSDIKFNKVLANDILESYIDYDKIIGDVVIRSREAGDKITLPSRNVTKTLKKLFTEMKIPLNERNLIPVIADEEKVLWVWGIGYNKVCAVDEKTKRILKIVGGKIC